MDVFNLKPDPVLGIDIGSTAVKLLEFSQQSNGQFQVESYGIETLPEQSIEDKSIIEIETVGEILNRVVKRAKPYTQYAAIAVAGPNVITKMITIDKDLPDEEIKEEIEADPEQYLGQGTEEGIYFDFQVIAPNQIEEDRKDVLLVASYRETVGAYESVVELGGLKTKIVDIEKYALENAFIMIAQNDPDINENDTIGLIEIGAITTIMMVLKNQNVIYRHEEMFGGKQLTEQIQTEYGLSYDEANLAKRNGNLPTNYFMTILDSFKMDIALQISRMVEYYYTHLNHDPLSFLLIAGGCASIPGIIEKIKEKVNEKVDDKKVNPIISTSTTKKVDIKIVDPFVSMSIAKRVNEKALKDDGPALMVACGLALRSFDFQYSTEKKGAKGALRGFKTFKSLLAPLFKKRNK